MSKERASKYKWQMVEMPGGISTSNGNWYHTTRENIEAYVPGLLKEHSLEKIIRQADDWVQSSNGLSLFLYLLLAFIGLDPVLTFGISLVFFLFWYVNTSAFVSVIFSPLVKLLNLDGFVYVVSTAVLIYLAWQEQFTALWLGIVLFFLFKVGLLNLILKLYSSKKESSKPQMNDRVLNMLLIRYGMKEGLMPEKVQEMQDNLIKTANYHKTRNKK